MENDYSWDSQAWSPQSRSRGGGWIVLFLLLSLFACVLLAILVPVGLGFIAGYSELQAQNHENAIQHFQRGLGYLAENYPELAYTEFEIAVKYDSAYEPARQKVHEMQATMASAPGPQEENRVAAVLFDEASDLMNAKAWDDAINRLEQLRALNTDYRAQEANDLLFQAYVASGKDAVAAHQIELARERFDSALTIRSGDVEVQRQRDLAVLYLDGQQAVGYNWQIAINRFSTLYQQDPNYDDVKRHLVEAYTAYGDLAIKQNASCLAVKQFDLALAITKEVQLSDKRTQAMALCRQVISAPPTPSPVPGSEVYVAVKIVKDTAKACNTGTGDVTGVVRDMLGQPLPGVFVAYYADGIERVTMRTNASGQYQFIWGDQPGVFHVIILSTDGKTQVSTPADVDYAGGSKTGCHILVDWQRVQ